jgi:hypothetical protein
MTILDDRTVSFNCFNHGRYFHPSAANSALDGHLGWRLERRTNPVVKQVPSRVRAGVR